MTTLIQGQLPFSGRIRRLRRLGRVQLIRSVLLIAAGVFAAAFGLKGFLLPNGFLDGGVTGISLLVNRLTGWSLPLLIVCINAPFIVMGFSQVGRDFAIKTISAISALAIALAVLPVKPMTSDHLLVAVFGGFFLGAGIGLAIRGGSVIDGTEVLSLFVSKRSGLTIGDVILLINVIIFIAAAWLLDLETALYSMLTYLSASKTVDFIVNGIEEYTGVTIISDRSEAIRQTIIHVLGRGVTIYKGERGFGKRGERNQDIDIVFTVVTRLELSRLKASIEQIDPGAFVVMHSIGDTRGGMIKKRPLH